MKILGLPGIKPVTAQWMAQLLDTIDLKQEENIIQQYQCWTHPGAQLNINTEATIAVKSNPDIVIAKSIGTRILIYAHSNHLISVKPFVLIGIPIKSYTESEIKALNKLCTFDSTLIIQQDNDPVGDYSILTSKISDNTSCKFAEVSGNDHFYGNIDELKLIIETWHHNLGTI